MYKKPDNIFKQICKISYWEEDNQSVSADILNYDERIQKGDYLFICTPINVNIFPYNAQSILDELPARLKRLLPSKQFRTDCLDHYANKCPHALTVKQCDECERVQRFHRALENNPYIDDIYEQHVTLTHEESTFSIET